MPKLRRVSGKEAIAALEKLGFVQVRQRGSHVVLRKGGAKSGVGCVVPMHKELAVGTLHNILKLAEVNVDEFVEKL
jgi:predicted RNA binding protein YcfA (HicA-like mRNA interferase family)